MMRAEITHLPMFDEYAFIEQHGQELTSDELEVLSERIDNLDRHIIAFNDAAIDMLHRAISDRAFEEGSVVAANLLELLAGMQRYVYRGSRSARRMRDRRDTVRVDLLKRYVSSPEKFPRETFRRPSEG